jgi:hypothetical protein
LVAVIAPYVAFCRTIPNPAVRIQTFPQRAMCCQQISPSFTNL